MLFFWLYNILGAILPWQIEYEKLNVTFLCVVVVRKLGMPGSGGALP